MQTYDVVVPVYTHPCIGFRGGSGRAFCFNGEAAFTVLNWPATFHVSENRRYIVVRTNCEEADARKVIELVIARLAVVSVVLDAGVRAAAGTTVISQGIADLAENSLVPAGTMPRVKFGDSNATVAVPIAELTEAFAVSPADVDTLQRAMEVYADVDFEASITSRFVLLATVLELVAQPRSRDVGALALVNKWGDEAKAAGRSDLASVVALMRNESITSSIRELVRSRYAACGHSANHAEAMAKAAGALYGQRSAVVHAAATVTLKDIVEFRRIVRCVLVGSEKPGVFTGIVERLNLEMRPST